MNEVALLKSMKHPNILECFEWWLSEKVYARRDRGNVCFVAW
jgi:hypothetical protein